MGNGDSARLGRDVAEIMAEMGLTLEELRGLVPTPEITWAAATAVQGTVEEAARLTEGRHEGTRSAVAWLAFSHLPLDLQRVAEPFYMAAKTLLRVIPSDSPELTTSLNGLVVAKDAAVRAAIRGIHGAPGPAPRSQEIE